MKNPIHSLRTIAHLEAISFLLLLGVAMPLKYVWHHPSAVRIAGMIHGLLFVAFCLALLRASSAARWPLARTALVFASSIVPFGPFLLDRRLRAYAASYQPASETDR